MAQRLDTTPDGIICKVCGQDKPPVHFFKHSGKYNQDFFTTELGYTPGVCFECASPYRCIVCHEVKPASDYRIQGRVCMACKTATPALNSDFDAIQVTEAIEGVETPESADYE